jgi:hypothetical protein
MEQPVSRGPITACGPNMVTRSDGARSRAACVSNAGYAQTSPGVATACNRTEYAPAYNRLAKCLRCQSGLEEPPNFNLTDGARSSKRAVCSECTLLHWHAYASVPVHAMQVKRPKHAAALMSTVCDCSDSMWQQLGLTGSLVLQ